MRCLPRPNTPRFHRRTTRSRTSSEQKLPTVRVRLSKFVPSLLAMFPNIPEQPSVFDKGPFESPITASLSWFPVGNELVLAWEVLLLLPKLSGHFRTLVNAQTGEIVYCKQLMTSLVAQANVYRLSGQDGREMVQMPLNWADYQLDLTQLPNGPPREWVDDSKTTAGYCVAAHLGEDSTTVKPARGTPLTFNPPDPEGDEQKILNLFYFNCFMHDFFYLLGFREEDGNFESTNVGRGDRVDARAYSGPVWGTANMLTPADRSTPIMNMGAFPSTGRHTALDSTVVFHEYTHGVTNRLVGGQRDEHALEQPQSRGMGEGWGDYIACTINKTDVVGAWLLNNEAGNRGFRYDSNFPDGFDKLGTGRYTEIHNIGEIWCATLLEMSRKIGDTMGLQLVLDALKLSPANPSFLDMRDSIIAALRNKVLAQQISQSAHDQALQGIWAAFAKFGMGPAARCEGAELSGIVADFNAPAGTGAPPPPGAGTAPAPRPAATGSATQAMAGADLHLEGRPNAAIPDGDPKGVTDTITVTKKGVIAGISVAFSVQHSYPADLQIELTPPGGKNVILYNREVDRRRSSEPDRGLRRCARARRTGWARNVSGAWALKVADVASGETGTFQNWSLDINLKGG